MAKVVIYSKPGCHLCDQMKERLVKLREEHAFELQERNILSSPEDFEKFKNEIPVIFINGRKAFKYSVDDHEFLKRLRRIEKESGDRNAS
jgi:glutaredoxin